MKSIISTLFLLAWISCTQTEPGDIPPNSVLPSSGQVVYQEMELIGFIHFGVNTFTDREWGTGKEDPSIFSPDSLDARQWAKVAKMAGMKQLIITAKHHDGFCLWPSAYTEHSVKKSPWKNGQGDVLKELAEACREEGIRMGIYLSPWDMHEPVYGTNEYNQFYLHQLEELLTGYGRISEIWMDGAKGENARDMEYDFDAYRALIYQLQPDALIFSDAGPDIRWIGNEKGIAGETNWSMINNENIVIGKADQAYLNKGDPEGNSWVVGECDVSVRPGWFYHTSQDDKVKSPEELVDLYYKSVGRNGTLLLNIPPSQSGTWHKNDIRSLVQFRAILDETFNNNLAHNAKTRSSGNYMDHVKFSPENVTDSSKFTYWAAREGDKNPWVEIDFGRETEFDRIEIREPIRLGQRIGGFRVDAYTSKRWVQIAGGTTVGYKRLLRIRPVKAVKIRLVITETNNIPAVSDFGIFKASLREPLVID